MYSISVKLRVTHESQNIISKDDNLTVLNSEYRENIWVNWIKNLELYTKLKGATMQQPGMIASYDRMPRDGGKRD